MMAMCCQLAGAVGFRGAEKALKIFGEYLGVNQKLPVHESIRTWLMRAGIARLLFHRQQAKDGQMVWFVDHSCQVGKEKALAVLGLRLSDLPPPGTPLKHEDLITLLVTTGESWKREDVAAQYQRLIEEHGVPAVINSDQAVELQEPALALNTSTQPVLVQTDPKHKLSNIIKSVIGNEEQFARFQTLIGQTRSAIQQTELSHFTPPKQKIKSRYMNLDKIIRWAEMVQWHLSNPHSASRSEIETDRMNEKLGWLRSCRSDVQRWRRCLRVVGTSLKFLNNQGLFQGATRLLKRELDSLDLCETSREVRRRILVFVLDSEKKLRLLKQPLLRVPMSTEILESVFGRYKQLEGQHSKGGFTSLLASFATLLTPITPEEVRTGFAEVSTKRMKEWIQEELGHTLQAKKNQAYKEYKNAVAA